MITRVAIASILTRRVYSRPAPERHHNLFPYMLLVDRISGVQGFLTDHDVFLDREAAGRHAIECGQIATLAHPPELFSEDLW